MMSAELRARVFVAAVGIPLAFLLIHLGGWYLAGLMAVAAALAANEFFDLAAAGGAGGLSAGSVFRRLPLSLCLPVLNPASRYGATGPSRSSLSWGWRRPVR